MRKSGWTGADLLSVYIYCETRNSDSERKEMLRSRLGLKVLGLSAMLLGLMAFVATSAQAEPNAKWAILKANGELVTIANPLNDPKGIGDALLPEVQITAIEELKDEKDPGKHLVLLSELGKKHFELLCTGAELENAAGTAAPKLLLEGTVLGRAKFTGCVTKIALVVTPACKPHTPGAAEGTILTELVKGLIKLHPLKVEEKEVKDDTVLFVPEDKESKEIEKFTTITLGAEGAGNECAAGEKITVNGKLSIEDCQGLFLSEQVTHLIQEFKALTELWILNKTTEHTAKIIGSAFVGLVGEHEGLKWAGLPG
jgi:hypothetical protein